MSKPKKIISQSLKQELIQDLIEVGQHFRSNTFQQNFIKELELAKNQKSSSLSYLTVHHQNIKPINESDLIVSIGGTNMHITKNQEIVHMQQIELMTDGQKFLDEIAVLISKYEPKNVSVDIGFPMHHMVNKFGATDGNIKGNGVKGHQYSNLNNLQIPIGEYIALQIPSIQYLQLANDTILGLHDSMQNNHSAFFVIGTGANLAILDSDGNLVNLEAGAFNNFPVPKILTHLDPEAYLSTKQPLEMNISGYGIETLYNALKLDGENLNGKQISDLAGIFDINQQVLKVESNQHLARLILSNSYAAQQSIEQAIKQYLDSQNPHQITFGYIGSVINSMHKLVNQFSNSK
jgi:hypothetical protein